MKTNNRKFSLMDKITLAFSFGAVAFICLFGAYALGNVNGYGEGIDFMRSLDRGDIALLEPPMPEMSFPPADDFPVPPPPPITPPTGGQKIPDDLGTYPTDPSMEELDRIIEELEREEMRYQNLDPGQQWLEKEVKEGQLKA